MADQKLNNAFDLNLQSIQIGSKTVMPKSENAPVSWFTKS